MTTDQKGAIAELAIAHAALALGVDVYRPVADGGRYDLIFDLGPTLARIQCKWAVLNGNAVIVRCYSSRRSADGMLVRRYTAAEVDWIAAYCAEVERCFLVPIDRVAGHRQFWIRLAPAKNNQTRGINRAADFDLAATLNALKGP